MYSQDEIRKTSIDDPSEKQAREQQHEELVMPGAQACLYWESCGQSQENDQQ